jgi:hypothetical protein
MRVVYTEVRSKLDSYHGTSTGKGSHSELNLRNLKGSHKTSITASKNMSTRINEDNGRSNFIRLDESVDVDVSGRSFESTV